jgi:hypothetical protein
LVLLRIAPALSRSIWASSSGCQRHPYAIRHLLLLDRANQALAPPAGSSHSTSASLSQQTAPVGRISRARFLRSYISPCPTLVTLLGLQNEDVLAVLAVVVPRPRSFWSRSSGARARSAATHTRCCRRCRQRRRRSVSVELVLVEERLVGPRQAASVCTRCER